MSRLARGRPLDHATNHQVSPNCEDLTKEVFTFYVGTISRLGQPHGATAV